jgi:L-lactate dehydrogenase
MTIHRSSVKIAVVGVGNVGATFAYAVLQSGLANELVLIDANPTKAEGEAMDLNHAIPFATPIKISAGTYEDCRGAAITVVTAGAGQKPGETRLDLVAKNTTIFQSIIPKIVAANPDGLLLIATNPVDILSYISWKVSGLSSEHVIGSGTILDTARFRYLLSQHAEVDPRSVHAYIIGEHGDSEVPVWSLANIAGMRLEEYCKANCTSFELQVWERIYQETKNAAYEIIQRKGATYYAVANGLLRICEAILRDQNTVLSVSTLIHGYHGVDNVYLSVPCVVGRNGIIRTINLDLSPDEEASLLHSADVLRETLNKVGY